MSKLRKLIETLDEPNRTIAGETMDALLAKMKVKRADQSRIKKNVKIRDENMELFNRLMVGAKNPYTAKLEYLEKRRLPIPPKKLTYRNQKRVTQLQRVREKLAGSKAKGLATLKARPGAKGPQEWANDVAQIPNPIVRAQIACLIWWDFFSYRTRENGQRHWDHLDSYMAGFKPGVSDRDTARALIDCGYHPFDAAARAIGGDIRS